MTDAAQLKFSPGDIVTIKLTGQEAMILSLFEGNSYICRLSSDLTCRDFFGFEIQPVSGSIPSEYKL